MRIAALLFALTSIAWPQAKEGARPPVIDIHVHTIGGIPGVGPMCPFNPQFLAADPREKASPIGWAPQDCTEVLEASKTPDEYMKAMLAEYERLNVTAVVMGDVKSVEKWRAAAPNRIIGATAFENAMSGGKNVPVEELRAAFTTGGFKVMGEVAPQYQGISPSDPSLDAYFALAEQLDIPVGIHMAREDRAVLTSPPRSSAARWAIRSSSRIC